MTSQQQIPEHTISLKPGKHGSFRLYQDFIKGLWRENPVFLQLLGLCPTLAVTTSAENGLFMGFSVIFVLVSAAAVVSLFRKVIPGQVRIVAYTAIIATFVTLADYFLQAKLFEISKKLGPYVPLIVVNCIILGRCEAFSSRHGVLRTTADALGMGLGFTWALVLLGGIRELLGTGKVFAFNLPGFVFDGFNIMGQSFEPWVVMLLPAGAFITLGILIGLMNLIKPKT
ncbi:MAG: electron transport complex subunit E [Candidatus Omnitrophica bacterium]|nr:electron transport complex subunit E [Candidatus Omnitrophota bacterium]